ncbi:type II 3-dehydroquinate dehydratase [Hoeflea sp.]|uniref:type II 3-dehydroquinate dehydratase n=1 Tax=Hoeflea sp. TaxID=1940281 RepID=UPI003B019B15
MARTVFVLNGPNLNALGIREPGIYGGGTLGDIEKSCHDLGNTLGLKIDFRQSNHEGVLVDWLQEAGEKADGVAINPGAYSHTSIALHDAIRSIDIPVVELHLSNIHAREDFRHTSMVSPVAAGVIIGFGPNSYDLALRALAQILES